MIRMAQWITSFLERRGAIDTDAREIYVYGAEILLYTFFSTMGLLVIGLFMRCLVETAIIIGLFYVNQSTGGGFHAATHTRCFLTMAAGLCACLAALKWPIPLLAYALLACGALFMLWRRPLVLHANKRYLESKREGLIKRSRRVTGVQAAACLLLLVSPLQAYIGAISLGLAASALSRALVGDALRRRTANRTGKGAMEAQKMDKRCG